MDVDISFFSLFQTIPDRVVPFGTAGNDLSRLRYAVLLNDFFPAVIFFPGAAHALNPQMRAENNRAQASRP